MLNLWRPKKIVGHMGAGGTPILVPEICFQKQLPNFTMLFLKTIFKTLLAYQSGGD